MWGGGRHCIYHFNSCSSAFIICSTKVYNILVNNTNIEIVAFTCIFTMVGFVALRPKSTAMVIAGRSVHLTTLFLGRLEQAVNQ